MSKYDGVIDKLEKLRMDAKYAHGIHEAFKLELELEEVPERKQELKQMVQVSKRAWMKFDKEYRDYCQCQNFDPYLVHLITTKY
jgi:FtsZ-binding cell division protein ZapB